MGKATEKPAVILLCAGYGTRMGALTSEIPKPLLEVAERPVLDYLLELLFELPELGVIHVVSNSLYLGAFESWAEGWRQRRPGLQLVVHDDGSQDSSQRLGAIGDLAFLLERSPCPAGALVAAGDNIFGFSLAPLWDGLRRDGYSRLLALHEPELTNLQRTGVLELADDGRVLCLHEKPDTPPSEWACPSLYALTSGALAQAGPYLAAGNPHDEIGRFIAHLVERQPVIAVRTRGQRLHVGSPEALRAADRHLRQNRVAPS